MGLLALCCFLVVLFMIPSEVWKGILYVALLAFIAFVGFVAFLLWVTSL